MTNFTYTQLGQNGRLGNQLWQIAGTLGIADKNGGSAVFPKWKYQDYFNVPKALFSVAQIGGVDLSPDYLQDLSLFSGIENKIRNYFEFTGETIDSIQAMYPGIDLSNMLGVHVRRGDYVSLPDYHPICPAEYYRRSIGLLGRYTDDIIIFSDDIQWCREQKLFSKAIFSTGNEIQDLAAMSMCNSLVISNSTFSWWGAWLNGTKNVIYPTNWYGPKVNADYTLMINGLPWIGVGISEPVGV